MAETSETPSNKKRSQPAIVASLSFALREEKSNARSHDLHERSVHGKVHQSGKPTDPA